MRFNHKKPTTIFLTSILFFIYLLVNTTVYSQIEWIYAEGYSDDDEANEILVDSKGDIYIIGKFQGTVDFDPSSTIYQLSTDHYNYAEIFIQKISALGNLIWVKKFGGNSGEAEVNSACIDNSDQLYISGGFTNTLDFDTGSGNQQIISSESSSDAFILKTSSEGDFTWVKTFGGYDLQYISRITLDSDNNIYTTGYYVGDIDLDPGNGIDNHSWNGNFQRPNVFVQKLNSDGSYIWGRTFGSDETYGSDVKVNQIGEVYVLGSHKGNTDFDPGISTFFINSPSRNQYILKLSSEGLFIWAKSSIDMAGPVGSNYSASGTSLALDAFGYIYSIGWFIGNHNFGYGNPDSIFEFNTIDEFNDYSDTYILKVSPDGEAVWAHKIGGVYPEYGGQLTISPLGQVIFTSGYSSENLDLDPSDNDAIVTTSGAQSAFFLSMDLDGNYIWSESIEGTCSHSIDPNSICHDDNGNIYVAGSFNGGIYLDRNDVIADLYSFGTSTVNFDAFFMKISKLSSIKEIVSNKEGHIFPNPSNGVFQIELKQHDLNILEIEIADNLGKVISLENYQIQNDIIKIDLGIEKFANGFYQLRIISNRGIYQQHISLNK